MAPKKKRLRPVFLQFFLGMIAAHAQETPSVRFQQSILNLQNSPQDESLRRNIIGFVATMNPKPPEPDAAIMAEGAAEYAFKHSQSVSDFSEAAKQYEKALIVAPWISADYFNCGVAHEKANENGEAIRNFSLYLFAEPNAPDSVAVKRRIGALKFATERETSPDGLAEKKYGARQKAFAQLMGRLDGSTFEKTVDRIGGTDFYEVRFYKSGQYNLLMYSLRQRSYERIVPIGESHELPWQEKKSDYVMPYDGSGKGSDIFAFPANRGTEFFQAATFIGLLSSDGQSVEEINFGSRAQETLGVWRHK